MREIKICETPDEIGSTFKTMRQLRAHLSADMEAYVGLVQSLSSSEGYRLVGLFEDGICRAAAGFRLRRSLLRAGEAELYIDDLVTDEAYRVRGFGTEFFAWFKGQAKVMGCVGIVLDSGLQRTQAHRFYRAMGMHETSLHFFHPLSPQPLVAADTHAQGSHTDAGTQVGKI